MPLFFFKAIDKDKGAAPGGAILHSVLHRVLARTIPRRPCLLHPSLGSRFKIPLSKGAYRSYQCHDPDLLIYLDHKMYLY